MGAVAKVALKFADAQLLIIGDGPLKYFNGLQELARRLGIADKVIFHKGCDDTTVPLSVIDVFCLPSLQEGLGLSIIEAMAMGVPVVASDVGGVSTLIKDKEYGLLVSPKDEQALAEALIKILENPSMAEKMARLSKEAVGEGFTLDTMTEKVLNLYHDVIEKRDAQAK